MIYTLLECLCFCMYPINVKPWKPIVPKVWVGPHRHEGPQGRLLDAQNYKKLSPKFLLFNNFWISTKNVKKSGTFFSFLDDILYTNKDKMLRDRATINSWNSRLTWSVQKALFNIFCWNLSKKGRNKILSLFILKIQYLSCESQ